MDRYVCVMKNSIVYLILLIFVSLSGLSWVSHSFSMDMPDGYCQSADCIQTNTEDSSTFCLYACCLVDQTQAEFKVYTQETIKIIPQWYPTQTALSFLCVSRLLLLPISFSHSYTTPFSVALVWTVVLLI